jgi:hypothetical protein
MTTLTDPVRVKVPARSPVEPAAPLDPPWDTESGSRFLERSYKVESRGRHPLAGWLTQWDRLAMSRGPHWSKSSFSSGNAAHRSERSFQDRSRSTQWDRLAMRRGQSLWSEAA